jgi:hypothetical protein
LPWLSLSFLSSSLGDYPIDGRFLKIIIVSGRFLIERRWLGKGLRGNADIIVGLKID